MGYSLEEVEGLGGWVNVIHPDDRAAASKFTDELSRGSPVITEYRIIDGSGNVKWLRDRIHPQLDQDGKLQRLTGGVTDITERKQLEEKLLRAQRLDAMARLAGAVAHDFNNLLVVRYGTLEELEADAASERAPATSSLQEIATSSLQEIRVSVEQTEGLTRALLAFGRKQVTVRRPVGLNALVGDSLPLLSRVASEGVHLRTELPAEDVVVAMDAAQVQLMLLNLCMNARDALPNGGEIVISVREVEWLREDPKRPAELSPGSWGCIEVRDDGVGMSDEVRQQVFEPFFTTKAPGMGTGLGLATVYGMALQMEGTVAVKSEPRKGSTFSIYLPRAKLPEEAAALSGFRSSVGGRERLLLVEDQEAVRRTLSNALSQRGYTVLTAGSAEEALALPADDLKRVALVMTDVRLPGKDGLALCNELTKVHRTLRVLLVSGYVPDAQIQNELSSGRFPFLAKPFSPEGLARRIRELLDDTEYPQ